MSDKQFINDLSATYANVRRLDAKKINLKGKNILEYLGSSTPNIKHAQDTRETVTKNDLWGQWVETLEDGTIIVHDDEVTNPKGSNYRPWLSNVKAVEYNKGYSEITTDAEGNFTGVVENSVVANIQTERIKDGFVMFYNTLLKSFSGDLDSLTYGTEMFYNTPLESFSGDLSSLINGQSMFSNTSLTSFTSDLSSLVIGASMFSNTALETFIGDLSNLIDGDSMFSNTALETFSGDLSSLTVAFSMFSNTSLTSFTSDLSNLINGASMFSNTALETFIGDLSSLVNGNTMFAKSKLSPQSVMYIAESIRNIAEEKAKYTSGEIPWVTRESNKYSAPFGFMENGEYVYTYNDINYRTITVYSSNVGKLTLGINVTNDSSTIQQQLEDFAKEATFDSWADLKQLFIDKGWTVTFQYGGTDTSITYGLREGERIIPCKIFAKLVQVEDKDFAEYCTEDGASFYNIEWGHDVTDTSSYTQFDSLEDAMTSWNVFPKENIISSEAEAQ